jgi:hypothetical protein
MSTLNTVLKEGVLLRGDIIRAVVPVALFIAAVILITSVVEFLQKHRKLVDVPVLNLEGWNFDKAKDVYNSDFTSLIKKGYEQVRDSNCVEAITVG